MYRFIETTRDMDEGAGLEQSRRVLDVLNHHSKVRLIHGGSVDALHHRKAIRGQLDILQIFLPSESQSTPYGYSFCKFWHSNRKKDLTTSSKAMSCDVK
jgi:hypothetical protein